MKNLSILTVPVNLHQMYKPALLVMEPHTMEPREIIMSPWPLNELRIIARGEAVNTHWQSQQ